MTWDCIQSIKKHTKGVSYEIIIVDNDSHDGSQEFLSVIPDITLVCSENNLGFGRGNNLGVSHANGELIFLLNTDTLLKEDSVSQLAHLFLSNEDEFNIGVLGCTLLDSTLQVSESAFKFVSAKSVFSDVIGTVNRWANKSHIIKKPLAYIDKQQKMSQVDYVSGAALLMRQSIFKSVGGFDNDYFMYFEEADLQKRVQLLGLTCVLTSDTQIIHLEGGSTDGLSNKLTNKRRIMIQKGRNLFLKKNDSKNYLFYVIFDVCYSFLRLFNRKYSFKENITFILENFKSY